MSHRRPPSFEDQLRALARIGLIFTAAALLAGLVLVAIDADESHVVLITGLAVLTAFPVVNIVIALIEETRRREWPFAAAALVVLAIVGYSVIRLL